MSQAHLNSRLALKDVLVPTDNNSILFHYDSTLNSTQGLTPVYNKVRYIRDWINGSTANAGNHWIEIQAYDENGVNVALNKTVTSSGANINGTPSLVTNGILDPNSYYETDGNKASYVQIDLGAHYNIQYIRVWHHWSGGRSYHHHRVDINNTDDGGATSIWINVFNTDNDGEQAETIYGRTIYLTNRPIYVTQCESKFDGSLAIMESTTNLLTNPSLSNSANGWNISNYNSRTPYTFIPFGDIYKIRFFTSTALLNGATDTEYGLDQTVSGITPGANYTFSIYQESTKAHIDSCISSINNSQFYCQINWQDSSGVAISTSKTITYNRISDNIIRWKVNGTAPANAAKAKIQFVIDGPNMTDINNYVYLYMPQLEQKAFSTGYIKGSRSIADWLEYQLPYAPQSISFYLKVENNEARTTDGNRYILRLNDGSANNYWELYLVGSSDTSIQNDLRLDVVYPNPDSPGAIEHRYCICYNINSGNNPKKNLLDGQWHFINIWFDNFYAYLKVDDILIKSTTLNGTSPQPFRVKPNFTCKAFGVGSSFNMQSRPGNIYIDELRIDNISYNPQQYVLKFDGTNDYVRIPRSTSLEPTSAITFSTWFNIQDKSVTFVPMSKTEGGSYNFENSSGTFKANLSVAGSYKQAVIPIGSIVNGKWHYVACTYDGTNVKSYLDGALQSTVAVTGSITHSTADLYIGCEANGTTGPISPYFNGMIGTTSVYQRALSQSEITQNYNEGPTGKNVVVDTNASIWFLDEGTGTTANSVTTSNPGTVYGPVYIPYSVNTDEADAWWLSNKPFYDPYDYSYEVL